jgi:hypothetical protein
MADETTTNATVEVWVLIGEGGDYVASNSPDNLAELYETDYDALADISTRRVRITLSVPLPRPVELVGTVAAEPEGGELVAK